jgi:predicted permease
MFPIFGLMAIGFGSARLRLIEEAGVRGLVLFVFNFSIPALLFDSMAAMTFPPDMEWGFLIAFYLASFTVYGLGAGAGRVGFGRPLDHQAIFGMGAAFSNLVLMGLPIVLTAFGPEGTLPMLLIIGFHSAIFMPVTVALIQTERGGEGPLGPRVAGVFADVLRNPIILGILAGFLVNRLGMAIWIGIASIVDFLAAAAVPCALFAMGGVDRDVSAEGRRAPGRRADHPEARRAPAAGVGHRRAAARSGGAGRLRGSRHGIDAQRGERLPLRGAL